MCYLPLNMITSDPVLFCSALHLPVCSEALPDAGATELVHSEPFRHALCIAHRDANVSLEVEDETKTQMYKLFWGHVSNIESRFKNTWLNNTENQFLCIFE